MRIRVPLTKHADGHFYVDLPTYQVVPGSVGPVTTVLAAVATGLGISAAVVNANGGNVPLVHKDGISPFTPDNHPGVQNATVLVDVPDEWFPVKPDGTRDASSFDLETLKKHYPHLKEKFVSSLNEIIKGNS